MPNLELTMAVADPDILKEDSGSPHRSPFESATVLWCRKFNILLHELKTSF